MFSNIIKFKKMFHNATDVVKGVRIFFEMRNCKELKASHVLGFEIIYDL